MKLLHKRLDFPITPWIEFQKVASSQCMFAGWLYDGKASSFCIVIFSLLICSSTNHIMSDGSRVSKNSDVKLFLICGGNGILCSGNPTLLIICMVVILCGNGKSWNCLSSLSVFLLPLIWNFNCIGLGYFWWGVQRLSSISDFFGH